MACRTHAPTVRRVVIRGCAVWEHDGEKDQEHLRREGVYGRDQQRS